MNETTVTTPNELEIRVERIFDAPRAHVFSVWTDPKLIPEWWGDGTVVEEMDVRPGGTYRFRTAYGVVEGEFREVDAPERLVQTFQNHLQTLEFEDLGEQDEADADDALRHDRGARHDDAVRRRGRSEGRLRARGRGAAAAGARRVVANSMRSAGRDEAGLVGVDHRLHAVAEVELLEDAGDVRLRRRLGDDELLADLRVRQAAREQVEDLVLARCQLGDRAGGRRAAAAGRCRANSSITARVTAGARSASPRATIRTAAAISSGGASLSMKPLAPARSAS